MKKLYLVLMLAFVFGCFLQSCNDGKTYAELKEEEADAINAFLAKNDIEVISEEEFLRDTVTKENQYVLFDDNGVYMNIVQRGVGEKLGDGSYEIHSRFMEIALQDRTELFASGDTLLANMHWNDYPSAQTDPETFRLDVSGDSYSATFMDRSKMASYYESSAVPSGWLVPIPFLKISRTTEASKVSRVKLIVPHSQGTMMASQYVYPCFYEITYNLGR